MLAASPDFHADISNRWSVSSWIIAPTCWFLCIFYKSTRKEVQYLIPHITRNLPISSVSFHSSWNPCQDIFRLTTDNTTVSDSTTKREIAYDVLGWFSPSIIKSKILLQKFWECKIDWDETVPLDLTDLWRRWKTELPLLSSVEIRRCTFLLVSASAQYNFTDSQMHRRKPTVLWCTSGQKILAAWFTPLLSHQKPELLRSRGKPSRVWSYVEHY